MKTIYVITLTYTDWKKECNILSKDNYNEIIFNDSEAMHMILSADSPDSEELND